MLLGKKGFVLVPPLTADLQRKDCVPPTVANDRFTCLSLTYGSPIYRLSVSSLCLLSGTLVSLLGILGFYILDILQSLFLMLQLSHL